MRIPKSIFKICILLSLSQEISFCNKAETEALDGSKPNLGGAFILDPTLLLLSPHYKIKAVVDGDGTPFVAEGEELDITLTLENFPDDPNEQANFQIYPGSPEIQITGMGENSYYSDYFLQSSQKLTIGLNLNLNHDVDCFDQDYYLIAVDTVSNVPQKIKINTADSDKCVYIATNGGKGWTGSFATQSVTNGYGAVEAADEICNSNVPSSFVSSLGEPSTYKAMLAVSYTGQYGVTRNTSTNWVFSPYSIYYGRDGKKEIFQFFSSSIVNFASEEFWTYSLGTSGRIWTGFTDMNWSTGTPSQSECASAYNEAGSMASWYVNSNTSGLTGNHGLAANTDYRSISEYTVPTSPTAGPLPVTSNCTKDKRFFVCVEQ
ncbi:DUF1554 domain-containing protein [Leptospira semungkisensis]|uniref:DUF1554 domain-containing protein n=1 Tax=Leptospira semungkisensis TaxID=2484985 RepID=A0A4R9G6P4_9LEPT|nr:DUF1554 domain-containing protein [Leptospira semungkisensis]TGK06875.1 DUF1554 domain-containing protein [Leptospira semungkisensis]